MAILTLVYVVTTWRMSNLMAATNQLASENIQMLTELERRRTRPVVIFEVTLKANFIYALVKNIGQSIAKDITISVNPPVEQIHSNRPTRLTTHAIPLLLPNAEVSDFLAVSHKFFDTYVDTRFEGAVTYKDSHDIVYNEPFIIGLEHLRGTGDVVVKGTADEIGKLCKSVDQLVSVLKSKK